MYSGLRVPEITNAIAIPAKAECEMPSAKRLLRLSIKKTPGIAHAAEHAAQVAKTQSSSADKLTSMVLRSEFSELIDLSVC
jgi:hypothetical protein